MEYKNLNKIKNVLQEFAIPKYVGMSMDELAKLLYIAAVKDNMQNELGNEEEEMARMDAQDAEQARTDAFYQANESLIN